MSRFNEIKEPVVCFRGSRENPKWLDEEKSMSLFHVFLQIHLIQHVDMYSTLCYVQADLSSVPKQRIYSQHLNAIFYQIRFDIILSFGLTEFRACIAWEEEVCWTISLSKTPLSAKNL